jgi:hypothetical protein
MTTTPKSVEVRSTKKFSVFTLPGNEVNCEPPIAPSTPTKLSNAASTPVSRPTKTPRAESAHKEFTEDVLPIAIDTSLQRGLVDDDELRNDLITGDLTIFLMYLCMYLSSICI